MNFREILQIEIWSKRTTRKILVVFGTVLGVVLVGFGALYEYETHWITRGERNAARIALAQIEALRDCGSCSDQEFAAKDKQVTAAVERAAETASTDRDNSVSLTLFGYLTMIESGYQEPRMKTMMQARHHSIPDPDPAGEERQRLSNQQMIGFMHVVLHKALD